VTVARGAYCGHRGHRGRRDGAFVQIARCLPYDRAVSAPPVQARRPESFPVGASCVPDHRSSPVQRARGRGAASETARRALLAEVATLYYVERRTQEEIARRIGRSVATVSRLLAKAHASEVVEVRIQSTVPIVPALQAALVQRFGLRTARVARVPYDDASNVTPQISNLAGRLISTLLNDGTVIAVSWGATVLSVIQAIVPLHQRDLHIVQGLGSLGSRMPTIDNPSLVQVLADRLDATPHFLPAPMIVESASVRDALSRDPYFSATLELCARPDIALIGIGAADPHQSGPVRAGYLEPWELERVRANGAVGDIVVEFYDLQGHILETEFGQRVMGMRQQELRQAGTVVAVAGGAAKVPAILGALRTGLIHVLVTDDITALRVLELDDVSPLASRARHDPVGELPSDAGSVLHGAETTRLAILDATLALLDRDDLPRLSVDALAFDADNDLNRRWRAQLAAAIEQAMIRGELVAGITPGTLADMLLGAVWYHQLLPREGATKASILHEIVALVNARASAADPSS
jgi:deoxyribonucleoside regulator